MNTVKTSFEVLTADAGAQLTGRASIEWLYTFQHACKVLRNRIDSKVWESTNPCEFQELSEMSDELTRYIDRAEFLIVEYEAPNFIRRDQ